MKRIADRLTWALEELAPADVRGNLKALQRELRERMGASGGTSYPAVLGYFGGKVSPSVEWLEEAARLLGVRSAWLIVGQGAPTEEQEAQRVQAWPRDPEQTERTRMAVFAAFREETPALRAIGAGSVERLILPAIEEVARWFGRAGLDLPGLEDEEGEQPGHRRYVEAARLLGRAVMAPLEALRLEPEYWTQGAKAQYLAMMLPTLATLADLEHSLGAMMRDKSTEKPTTDPEGENGEG